MKTKVTFTQKQKENMYANGQYLFPYPAQTDVCIANWDREDWIHYIDKSGRWMPREITLAQKFDRLIDKAEKYNPRNPGRFDE